MYMVNKLADNPWIAFHRPNSQAHLRLFCFPYSGAGASIFYKWPDGLPKTVEVCSVQLPGRETRLSEPLFTRLTPLVEATAKALRPHLDKPFAFFGHSLGALVSYELARYLRRHDGLMPLHLFVSGHSAPHLPKVDPPIHDLPEPEFVAELRRFNGTPDEVLEHVELRELILPILRADFEMYETYAHETDHPLECPISAFGGLQDEEVSRERLEPWREHTNGAFSLRMFPGDHFFLNTSQSLLLQALARELGQLVHRPL